MHESGAQTEPEYPADWIEWGFKPGDPALVAGVPDDSGDMVLIRLDHIAPESTREREFVKALMRIAQGMLDASEPSIMTGAAR